MKNYISPLSTGSEIGSAHEAGFTSHSSESFVEVGELQAVTHSTVSKRATPNSFFIQKFSMYRGFVLNIQKNIFSWGAYKKGRRRASFLILIPCQITSWRGLRPASSRSSWQALQRVSRRQAGLRALFQPALQRAEPQAVQPEQLRPSWLRPEPS